MVQSFTQSSAYMLATDYMLTIIHLIFLPFASVVLLYFVLIFSVLFCSGVGWAEYDTKFGDSECFLNSYVAGSWQSRESAREQIRSLTEQAVPGEHKACTAVGLVTLWHPCVTLASLSSHLPILWAILICAGCLNYYPLHLSYALPTIYLYCFSHYSETFLSRASVCAPGSLAYNITTAIVMCQISSPLAYFPCLLIKFTCLTSVLLHVPYFPHGTCHTHL